MSSTALTFKYGPLTVDAIRDRDPNYISSVQPYSDKIEALIKGDRSPWQDSKVTMLVTTDAEVDDGEAIKTMLDYWKLLPEKDRFKVVIAAGDRWRGDSGFGGIDSVVHSRLPHARRDVINPSQTSYYGGKVIALEGSSLQDIKTDKTRSSTKQLRELLGSDPFCIKNMTSLVQAADLGETMKGCKVLVKTSTETIDKKGTRSATNRWFSEDAHDEAMRLSERFAVPTVSFRGSNTGLDGRMMSDLTGWGDLSMEPVLQLSSIDRRSRIASLKRQSTSDESTNLNEG